MPANPRQYHGALARLRAERGGKCEACGKREQVAKLDHRNGLEFAHVVTTGLNGRGRGRAERYHDIKANPSHYRLLCRPCHLVFDRTEGPKLPKEAPF